MATDASGKTTDDISTKEDNRPETSPYLEQPITFFIGPNRIGYYVPQLYARQSPAWTFPPISLNPHETYAPFIELPEVDDDTGHTLVHYLCTGTYQTLKPQAVPGFPSSNSSIEFRRGILAYLAARSYQIDGLVQLARSNVELYEKGLSIFEILDIIKDIYPNLPGDEIWLPAYLKTKIEAAYEVDETIFTTERFLNYIGEATAFNKALVKIMVGTFTEKITGMAKKEAAKEDAPKESIEECPLHDPPPPSPEPYKEEPTAQESGLFDAATAAGAFDAKSMGSDNSWDSFSISPRKKKGVKPKSTPAFEEDDAWQPPIKKGKKGKKADQDVVQTPMVIEEEPVIVNELDPIPCEKINPYSPQDEDSNFWASLPKRGKKGKKGKKHAIPVDDEAPWESALPAKEAALCEETAQPFPQDSFLEIPSPSPPISQNSICPLRAQHMLSDSWESCDKCCAMIRQISIQLAQEQGNLG